MFCGGEELETLELNVKKHPQGGEREGEKSERRERGK